MNKPRTEAEADKMLATLERKIAEAEANKHAAEKAGSKSEAQMWMSEVRNLKAEFEHINDMFIHDEFGKGVEELSEVTAKAEDADTKAEKKEVATEINETQKANQQEQLDARKSFKDMYKAGYQSKLESDLDMKIISLVDTKLSAKDNAAKIAPKVGLNTAEVVARLAELGHSDK